MFESLPYLYAAMGGGVVAFFGNQWIIQRKATERSRLIEDMTKAAKRLAAVEKGEDAAEVAAREAREAVRLDELKTAVSELK